jgi:kynurenine formamidase
MLAGHLKTLIKKSRVFDLGQPYFTGMPHHPNQPPFAYTFSSKIKFHDFEYPAITLDLILFHVT